MINKRNLEVKNVEERTLFDELPKFERKVIFCGHICKQIKKLMKWKKFQKNEKNLWFDRHFRKKINIMGKYNFVCVYFSMCWYFHICKCNLTAK